MKRDILSAPGDRCIADVHFVSSSASDPPIFPFLGEGGGGKKEGMVRGLKGDGHPQRGTDKGHGGAGRGRECPEVGY